MTVEQLGHFLRFELGMIGLLFVTRQLLRTCAEMRDFVSLEGTSRLRRATKRAANAGFSRYRAKTRNMSLKVRTPRRSPP